MNWFQNCIFVWAITSYNNKVSKHIALWIDFKIVFLCEQSQGVILHDKGGIGCELISKLYFCVSNHKKKI